jgi:hypothetical protein
MSVTPKQTLADQARGKPLFFWIALLVGVVMLGLYLFAGVMIARYGSVTRDSGWKPERRDGQWVVREVDPQGAAAGKLQADDVILAVNDTRALPTRARAAGDSIKPTASPEPWVRDTATAT